MLLHTWEGKYRPHSGKPTLLLHGRHPVSKAAQHTRSSRHMCICSRRLLYVMQCIQKCVPIALLVMGEGGPRVSPVQLTWCPPPPPPLPSAPSRGSAVVRSGGRVRCVGGPQRRARPGAAAGAHRARQQLSDAREGRLQQGGVLLPPARGGLRARGV